MNPLLIPVIGDLFKGIFDVVDSVHTSEEEKLNMKQQIFNAQAALYSKVLDFETRLSEAQAKIIEAEAQSENWLAANWRPLVMLIFTGLIVNKWTGLFTLLGLPPVYIEPEIEKELWMVIQIGLGGYVAGRSLEKIAPAVAEIMKKNG
jgi:hypothetical protein